MMMPGIQIPPIPIGNNVLNGRELLFQPSHSPNGHGIWTGSSGMGKSGMMVHVAFRLYCAGVRIVLFDFHDDMALVGLRTLRIGDGSPGGVLDKNSGADAIFIKDFWLERLPRKLCQLH